MHTHLGSAGVPDGAYGETQPLRLCHPPPACSATCRRRSLSPTCLARHCVSEVLCTLGCISFLFDSGPHPPYSCHVLSHHRSMAACSSQRTVTASHVRAAAPCTRQKESHSPANRIVRHSVGACVFTARIAVAVARAQCFADADAALAMPIQLVSHALYPLRGLILSAAHLPAPRMVSVHCRISSRSILVSLLVSSCSPCQHSPIACLLVHLDLGTPCATPIVEQRSGAWWMGGGGPLCKEAERTRMEQGRWQAEGCSWERV